MLKLKQDLLWTIKPIRLLSAHCMLPLNKENLRPDLASAAAASLPNWGAMTPPLGR